MPKEELLFLETFRELVECNGNGRLGAIIASGDLDWGRFRELLVHHELITFIYPLFKDFSSAVPPAFMEALKNNYYHALLRNQGIWKEFLRIWEAFQKEDILVIPIKGVSFLEDIYRKNPVRFMVDIDLLSPEKDFARSEQIFLRLGYHKELLGLKEEYWRKKQYHITFHGEKGKKLPVVELHWGLDYKRQNKHLLPQVWQRLREIGPDDFKIKVLCAEDALFSLALHNRRFGKPLCLKNILDLALLLNKYRDGFDWEYVLLQSRKYRMRATVFFILAQLNFASGRIIHKNIEQALGVSVLQKKIIRRFIRKNTFSLKSEGLYLKSHFLLYDNIWEPVEYILHIPQEQFSRYYQLPQYSRKTVILYRLRFFYIPFKAVLNLNKTTGFSL